MFTTSQIGTVGELKSLTAFVEHGFDVFVQYAGNGPFDFVAHRDDKLWKVEVRTTNRQDKNGAYPVELTGTIYGPDRTVIHKPLKKSIDILVVYIVPINTLIFKKRSTITAKKCMTFREHPGKTSYKRQNLVSDYLNLEDAL